MTRPAIELRIHDSHLGIWQENAKDETFRTEIYDVLIRDLRTRGWSIKRDPNIHTHYRSISVCHRVGTRGTLRCAIEITGRHVKIEFWSVTSAQTNRNGRRYDFDKLARMAYLDRLRVEIEFTRITSWLETLAPVKVSRSNERQASPMSRIEKAYAESWHRVEALGRPTWTCDYSRKAGDGVLLEQGQVVWLADGSGRVIRGRAFYHINNMWWVIAGGALLNECCSDLYTAPPADLRTKRNERERRKRLEIELALAVQRMNFARAQLLKRIIFGADEIFMIWARDHSAYYRPQYAGYTTDRIAAGKYTRAEAEAECRRVPHELEMVCPDGKHISFDKVRAA